MTKRNKPLHEGAYMLIRTSEVKCSTTKAVEHEVICWCKNWEDAAASKDFWDVGEPGVTYTLVPAPNIIWTFDQVWGRPELEIMPGGAVYCKTEELYKEED